MKQVQDRGLGPLTLKEGDCAWRGHIAGAHGPLWFWIETDDGAEPQQHQIELLRTVVTQLEECRHEAVAFVRADVQAKPDSYGLEETTEGPERQDSVAWITASLDEYLGAFKLSQVGIPIQAEAQQVVYLAFETELDVEHGVAVELTQFRPLHIGMVADYGPMLML